jgi:hypothetical protein
MNTFLTIVILIILVNAAASFIPFLMPRAPAELVLPYQLWFNAILVFILVLPHSVGNFSLFKQMHV